MKNDDTKFDAGGIALGQDVYFFGFPYEMGTEVGKINRLFPAPFVKHAILSASSFSENKELKNPVIFMLDGYNDPGFSGGPVVFENLWTKKKHIFAVISGYKPEKQILVDKKTNLQLESYANTGIIISYSIKHAIDAIKLNPIGMSL